MSNAAKKIANVRKTKRSLKLVDKVHSNTQNESYSFEELVKMYPGLSLENAALLSQAHSIFKKTAA